MGCGTPSSPTLLFVSESSDPSPLCMHRHPELVRIKGVASHRDIERRGPCTVVDSLQKREAGTSRATFLSPLLGTSTKEVENYAMGLIVYSSESDVWAHLPV